MSPTIQELIQDGNREPLFRILRRHPDHRFRIEAARGLSQLQDPDCVEALIRSLLDDADPEVRAAANAALIQCLGATDAALAIKAYGSVDGVMPYEAYDFSADLDSREASESSDDDEDDSEPEPESDEIADSGISAEFLDFSIEEKPIRWDIEEIGSLILILNDDNHPERQMKALRIIAGHPSPAGIDALSTVALWSENLLVKNAAYQALKKLYAEDTDRLLAEFRTSQTASAVEEEEDDEFAIEIEQPLTSVNQFDHSPTRLGTTIEPEGLNGRAVLFVLVILFAIAAFLIYWYMLR